MQDAMDKLHEFHDKFGCAIGTNPKFSDEKTRKLRRKLIREEVNEFFDAEDDDNFIEVADALADICYVVLGTAVAYGIPLAEIFNHIHESNMSKLDKDGRPIYRESDNKVLKGPNYWSPDIKAILNRTERRLLYGD